MRVLYVMPDLPYPPHNGGKIRNFNFIQMMAEKGHDVTLVASDRRPEEDGRAAALAPFCEELIAVPLEEQQTLAAKRRVQLRSIASRHPYHRTCYFAPSMQKAIDRVVAARDYDVIHVAFAQMGYYSFPREIPIVLDNHNAEFDLLRRIYENEARPSIRKLYSYLEWKKFERDELANCRAAQRCLVTSDRDKAIFEARLDDTPFEVLANGVDLDFYAPDTAAPVTDNVLLFTGTIDYFPNTEGLIFFFEEILPKIRAEVPDVRFVVAGRNPPPSVMRFAEEPGVTITGAVDDIRPYYRQAKIVVVPLRLGGGTRLKILEAMAMLKPVVSTSVGAEGNEAQDGEHLLLADDPASFAAAVVRLLGDDAERQRLEANGAKLVAETYDWNILVDQLCESYERAIAAHGGR